MAILEYDKDASNRLLAVYTTPDVEQQRSEFLNIVNLQIGEKVLDVGTGPGFLARAIAKIVSPRGAVYGIDISEFLLDVAKSENNDLHTISFRYGEATQTGFSNGEFDTVVCTQVLEYVPDVNAALKGFNRVLNKGGKLAILDTDWDSIVWNTSHKARMKRVLKAWEAHAAYPFLPRTLTARMEKAGFQIEAITIIPLLNSAYDPNTYSNRMIDLIVPFVVETGKVKQEEADAWANDLRRQKAYFFSLNRYLFLGTKI